MAACTCFLCAGGVASAQLQARIDYRFLIQEIAGSGASRVISNAPDNLFSPGSRIRLTLQYKLENLNADGDNNDATNGPRTNWLYGQSGQLFHIVGTGVHPGGTLHRSRLTTSGLPAPGGSAFSGEADGGNNSVQWPSSLAPAAPMGQMYPQTGQATTAEGLHQPFRFTLNGNGTISGSSINTIFPLQVGADVINQLEHNWWGQYSFEFQSDPAQTGAVQFAMSMNPDVIQIYRGGVSPEDEGVGAASGVLVQPSAYELGLASTTLLFEVPGPAGAAAFGIAALVTSRRRRS